MFMPVEGRGGGGGRPMCCAGADAGWRGGGGIWYMAAWWAKAYEGLEGPLGVGGGAPCCAAMRCEGSTGRAANGRLARSDSTAEPQGELAKHSGRGRGRGRAGGGRFGRKRQREALARRGCRVLACVAGGCAVKELLRASRHGAAGGSSSGCGRRAAGALSLSLSLSPLGGRRGVPVWHQQTDLVASRCLESSVLAVRLGWLRSGYECDMTRGQGSGAVAVAVGGARSWGRGSGRINGRQRRPGRTETETEARPRRSAQRHRNEQ